MAILNGSLRSHYQQNSGGFKLEMHPQMMGLNARQSRTAANIQRSTPDFMPGKPPARPNVIAITY
jgi:hypothetical protein